MNWRSIGALLSGGAFQVVNPLVLLLTGVWLRFSTVEPQILAGGDHCLIPGGIRSEPLGTMDALAYRSLPFAIAVLLMFSSACFFADVCLAK